MLNSQAIKIGESHVKPPEVFKVSDRKEKMSLSSMTVEQLGRAMMELPGDKTVYIEVNGELYPIKKIKERASGNISISLTLAGLKS